MKPVQGDPRIRHFVAGAAIAIAMLVGIVAFNASQAQEVQCSGPRWATLSIVYQHNGVKIIELTPAQRAAATANYNNLEPKSDFAFDGIYRLAHDDPDRIGVVFVIGGCVHEVASLTPELFEALLNGPGRGA